MKRDCQKHDRNYHMAQSLLKFITFITFLFTVNVIRQMAPLFSRVDSNKLWHDVRNEETLISAKFGKDLFTISKVIGRKTKWPRFFWPTRYVSICTGICIIAFISSQPVICAEISGYFVPQ